MVTNPLLQPRWPHASFEGEKKADGYKPSPSTLGQSNGPEPALAIVSIMNNSYDNYYRIPQTFKPWPISPSGDFQR